MKLGKMFKASALVVGLGLSLTIPGLSMAATSQIPASVEAQHTELSQAAKEWQATGNYMTIEGHNVFYHDVGEGPVIVLLHGHPSSSLDWRETVDILKDKARLITFDHVGWGLSDKPVAFSYSLMEMADITEEILNELDVKSAHVVSHDISTSVHNELMARHLEGSLSFDLESSMLTNGSMIQWISEEPPEQKLAESNETLFKAIDTFSQVGPSIPQTLTGMTLGNLSEERIDLMSELLLRDNGAERLAAQSLYMRERYVHAERWLGAISNTHPLRIVWAKDDPVANVKIGRELNKIAPNADYVEIKGIGHFPNAEAPEQIAEHILISTGLSEE